MELRRGFVLFTAERKRSSSPFLRLDLKSCVVSWRRLMLSLIAIFAILTGLAVSVLSYRALAVVSVVSLAIFALALTNAGWGVLTTIAWCAVALILQQASFLAVTALRTRIKAEVVRIRATLRSKPN